MELQLIPVKDNNTKIQAVTATVQRHFLLGDTLLIAVHSDEAAEYLDRLLWKVPQESFIPHSLLPSSCPVTIAKTEKNITKASVILNLRPDPFLDVKEVTILYDLLDSTSKEREELSLKRKEVYLKF